MSLLVKVMNIDTFLRYIMDPKLDTNGTNKHTRSLIITRKQEPNESFYGAIPDICRRLIEMFKVRINLLVIYRPIME